MALLIIQFYKYGSITELTSWKTIYRPILCLVNSLVYNRRMILKDLLPFTLKLAKQTVKGNDVELHSKWKNI